MLATDVVPRSRAEEWPTGTYFIRGDNAIKPIPSERVDLEEAVYLYFEIYGLDTDSEGLGLYSIDYRIIPNAKRRKGPVLEPAPIISSQFETAGFGSTQTQRLEIATDNLWEGAFTLIVEVMDRRTRHLVEQRSNFSILE